MARHVGYLGLDILKQVEVQTGFPGARRGSRPFYSSPNTIRSGQFIGPCTVVLNS